MNHNIDMYEANTRIGAYKGKIGMNEGLVRTIL
jgi:hypothetical protein